jgi:hypothetical protein
MFANLVVRSDSAKRQCDRALADLDAAGGVGEPPRLPRHHGEIKEETMATPRCVQYCCHTITVHSRVQSP